MKKLFAILAVMGVLTLGSVQPIMAQDAAPAQTEQTTEAAVVEEGGGLHKELKTKFIEGDAGFMSLVAIALVLGLAFCIERIIYLSLAEVNTKKLMTSIEAALEKGDVEAAKTVCRNTRGLDRKEVDAAMKQLKAEGAIVSPVRCKWAPAE